ncbi:TPA: hypothetical protein PXJ89_002841 [Yersinia enterocolitica]|nr:hypothetical protein [Yersinia enterocolitica]
MIKKHIFSAIVLSFSIFGVSSCVNTNGTLDHNTIKTVQISIYDTRGAEFKNEHDVLRFKQTHTPQKKFTLPLDQTGTVSLTIDDSNKVDIQLIRKSLSETVYGIAKITTLTVEETVQTADSTISIPTYKEVEQRFSIDKGLNSNLLLGLKIIEIKPSDK